MFNEVFCKFGGGGEHPPAGLYADKLLLSGLGLQNPINMAMEQRTALEQVHVCAEEVRNH